MINLNNISKSFMDDAGVKNELLNSLNINFNQGEFAIVIGANGSGKSTLLNLIAGIILPDKVKPAGASFNDTFISPSKPSARIA